MVSTADGDRLAELPPPRSQMASLDRPALVHIFIMGNFPAAADSEGDPLVHRLGDDFQNGLGAGGRYAASMARGAHS